MEKDPKVAASEGTAESCRCHGACTHCRCPLINQGLSWNSFEVNLDIRPNELGVLHRALPVSRPHLFTPCVFVSVSRSRSQTAGRR